VPEAFYTMRNELQNYGDIVIPIFAGYALFFVALTLPAGLIFGWMAKRWPVAR
jgi:glutamate transport system permease protein